jgi:hypothetical protein
MEEFILPTLSLLAITGMIFIPLQHLQVKSQREDLQELRRIVLKIAINGWVLIVDSVRQYDNDYVRHLTRDAILPRSVLTNIMDTSDKQEGRKVTQWFRENNDMKLLKNKGPMWYHLPSGLAIEHAEGNLPNENSKNLLYFTEISLQNVLQIFEKNNLVRKNTDDDVEEQEYVASSSSSGGEFTSSGGEFTSSDEGEGISGGEETDN